VGQELDILAEGSARGRDGMPRTVARSERDAPEVDGVVFVAGELPPGTMTRVRVTGAGDYDLEAEPLAVAAAVDGD
jgi:ribosomal protein S12 methylthiotransferase